MVVGEKGGLLPTLPCSEGYLYDDNWCLLGVVFQ